MNCVLVIGGGAREHALAGCLALSPIVDSIVVCPGNAGTRNTPKTKNRPLNIKKHKEVIELCQELKVSLVVIGPEDPLADGLADSLMEAGIKVFGPSKEAARIESSKAWAKDFMKRNSIPTADYETFTQISKASEFIEKSCWKGFAIKASGLAGGKGVRVAEGKESANKALEAFESCGAQLREASETLVLEEKLCGFEVSVLAFCDGSTVRLMPPVQDHKQRFAGGVGPNTGGMGAYCPCELVSSDDLEFIKENIIQKTVDCLKAEGHPYYGVLYAGIMVTEDGPKVLEFNCRFGDPEAEAVLTLLQSDLYDILMNCINGKLDGCPVDFYPELYSSVATVVIESYPDDVTNGCNMPIQGIDSVTKVEKCSVFIAGAKFEETSKEYLTTGGRVINVCGTGRTLLEAVDLSLKGAAKISFRNAPSGYKADFRGDIGFQAIKRVFERSCPALNYKEAGVDISEGNRIVDDIRSLSKSTYSNGVKCDLGMFGAVFDTKSVGYDNPLLISGTDGVGTKLKIAIESGNHRSVGQDLVAMCVNDVLVHGAEPLFFLDYFASGKMDSATKLEVIEGISRACKTANCALVGGETAEMPGMYKDNDYDLAGFVVGAASETDLLPKMNEMESGNVLIGIASSGLHSNGFSLLRKILDFEDVHLNGPAPFNPTETLAIELLKPTVIYAPLLKLLRSGLVLGAAHITGGGIEENLLRVIPDHLGVTMEAVWKVPSVFSWLSALGIKAEEMFRTFNMGLGFILIVKKELKDTVMDAINTSLEGEPCLTSATYPPNKAMNRQLNFAWVIGSLIHKGEKQFKITGLEDALVNGGAILKDSFPDCIPYLPRKRVAVLISGSGTNLQALLDHTKSGPSRAEVVLVISNVENVKGLQRATEAGVPSVVIKHGNYSSRSDFELQINKTLRAYRIELVCLAGFMRILTGNFVRQWAGRMLNIHPSLLPSFKGKDAQKQALEAGVCVTGCTVHFVVEEVDAGAIITQEAVPLLKSDDVDTLSCRIRQAEHKAYPRALELVARRKVFLDDEGNITRN